jgi:hypothetical protein
MARRERKSAVRLAGLGAGIYPLIAPDYLSDAVEKIAMRDSMGDRKAHVSGAVIPLRPNEN